LRTRLELIIKSHGIKPARLAAEASYSRGHLARAREGEPTSARFQEGVTTAIRCILGRAVMRTELFEPEGVAIRALLPRTKASRRSGKKTPRQSARPENLGSVASSLAEADLEAWLARLRTTPGAATETATRDLVDAAFSLLDRQPARAEQLYTAAVGLTERLATSPPLLVVALRGYAEKGRANALRMLGRYQEAMKVLIGAEQHFVDARYCTFEIGEVRYARAGILFKMEKWPQAQEAAGQARRIFEEEHNRTRALHARLLEGCVLVERGNLDAGRAVFSELLKKVSAKHDKNALAWVYMNLGACDLKRRQPSFARHWLYRATQLFRQLGMASELVRARWCGAKITIVEGHSARGIRELRAAMRDFERLSMPADAGFVGLDLLEELMTDHSAAKEAEELARSLAQFFLAAGVNISAATALTYLRHAAEKRKADGSLIAYVRAYIHRADVDPDRPFEPPTSGMEPM
jgi:tetratricopeptide (TPR) repeat protein